MADQWESEDRIAALGYDPFDGSHEHEITGALEAVETMLTARTLLDFVAFVAEEGDTQKTIQLLDKVLLLTSGMICLVIRIIIHVILSGLED
jgi:hypothetical protein